LGGSVVVGILVLIVTWSWLVGAIIVVVIYGVIVTLGLVALVKSLRSRWRDSKRLKKYQKQKTLNRQQISNQFYKFETESGRSEYVHFIRNEGIKPDGIWPEGQIPNVKNDEASTLLAKLEEKWLGLDK